MFAPLHSCKRERCKLLLQLHFQVLWSLQCITVEWKKERKFLPFLRPSIISSLQNRFYINQTQPIAWCFTVVDLMSERSLGCRDHLSCSNEQRLTEVNFNSKHEPFPAPWKSGLELHSEQSSIFDGFFLFWRWRALMAITESPATQWWKSCVSIRTASWLCWKPLCMIHYWTGGWWTVSFSDRTVTPGESSISLRLYLNKKCRSIKPSVCLKADWLYCWFASAIYCSGSGDCSVNF